MSFKNMSFLLKASMITENDPCLHHLYCSSWCTARCIHIGLSCLLIHWQRPCQQICPKLWQKPNIGPNVAIGAPQKIQAKSNTEQNWWKIGQSPYTIPSLVIQADVCVIHIGVTGPGLFRWYVPVLSLSAFQHSEVPTVLSQSWSQLDLLALLASLPAPVSLTHQMHTANQWASYWYLLFEHLSHNLPDIESWCVAVQLHPLMEVVET